MGKKLLIVDVAALSREPSIAGLTFHEMQSVFPALTCPVQASFRTASRPSEHGMVANGLFMRDLNRPMFWEQSAGLVKGPRIWEGFRKKGKRVAMLFWQQSLGEEVDMILSPAPIHKHHGGMVEDCYSRPEGLYPDLCKRIGRPFKLRQYWGPLASWKVGEWIVDATSVLLEDNESAPDLCLTYLPTLDYELQRKNPQRAGASSIVQKKVESQLTRLAEAAARRGYEILIFGDYHIAPVDGAVFPNMALREAGLMKVRRVKDMLYPDFCASRAFTMVDHEIAHVYVRDEKEISVVKGILKNVPGVAEVFDREAQRGLAMDHGNSGELIVTAEEGKWLAYPWWRERREAPEFAAHVDIHNKPGYDPCELFFGWPPGSVSMNPSRVQGSHGRVQKGREVVWASSLSISEKPSDLVELSGFVRQWLQSL